MSPFLARPAAYFTLCPATLACARGIFPKNKNVPTFKNKIAGAPVNRRRPVPFFARAVPGLEIRPRGPEKPSRFCESRPRPAGKSVLYSPHARDSSLIRVQARDSAEKGAAPTSRAGGENFQEQFSAASRVCAWAAQNVWVISIQKKLKTMCFYYSIRQSSRFRAREKNPKNKIGK